MDTISRHDAHAVTTLEALADLYPAPKEAVLLKETDYVTEPGRKIIESAPFLIMATATEDGIDCSPKGDAPGFVKMLDERTLLVPDRPGNNRLDGLKNILKNPKVGLIFIVPGSNVTYRVNGNARITTDPDLMKLCEAQGKLPRSVTVVTVEQAFHHCPKALIRSDFWDAGLNPPEGIPTSGTFAAFRTAGGDKDAERYDAEYARRIPGELY